MALKNGVFTKALASALSLCIAAPSFASIDALSRAMVEGNYAAAAPLAEAQQDRHKNYRRVSFQSFLLSVDQSFSIWRGVSFTFASILKTFIITTYILKADHAHQMLIGSELDQCYALRVT